MASERFGDRREVEIDGERVEVFNHVSVSTHHYVNSINGYDTFEPIISKGDMGGGPAPEAVTERVADLLWAEWGIGAEAHDIRVVDPEDEGVELL